LHQRWILCSVDLRVFQPVPCFKRHASCPQLNAFVKGVTAAITPVFQPTSFPGREVRVSRLRNGTSSDISKPDNEKHYRADKERK
jgi:hypothetical protein